jgi:hypothetical protein
MQPWQLKHTRISPCGNLATGVEVPCDGTTGGNGSTHPRRMTEQPGLFADVCASAISTSQRGSDNGATVGLERHPFDISRNDRGRKALDHYDMIKTVHAVSVATVTILSTTAGNTTTKTPNPTAQTMAVGHTLGVQGHRSPRMSEPNSQVFHFGVGRDLMTSTP